MVGYVFEEMMLQANNTREPTKLEFLEEKHQIILFFSSVQEIFFFQECLLFLGIWLGIRDLKWEIICVYV